MFVFRAGICLGASFNAVDMRLRVFNKKSIVFAQVKMVGFLVISMVPKVLFSFVIPTQTSKVTFLINNSRLY